MFDIAQAALDFHALGAKPLPLAAKTKRPIHDDWPNAQFEPSNVEAIFSQSSNIGIVLGQNSGGIVDVDIDAPEAEEYLHFLPATDCTFGRASRYTSHLLYRVNGCAKTQKFLDPLAKKSGAKASIVEIRADGSQTMVPPSVHPNGERITWRSKGQPEHVEHSVLVLACVNIAKAVIAKRYGEDALSDPDVQQYFRQFEPRLSKRARATTPCSANAGRKAGFGATALDQECALIASSVEGSRNDALTKSAIKIGSIIASGCLDEHAARNALLSAAMQSGLSKAEATTTINSAISIGKKNPRYPSERPMKKVCDTMQEPQSPDTEPKGDEGAKKVTEELLEIADDFEIFCDLSGEAYATLRETGETITAQLASRYIKDILVTEYFEKTGKLAGETQVKLVIELLSAKARRSGDRRKVNLRVGEHNGAIYLDLGKRFVQMNKQGWSIIDEAPIPFRRPPAMQALPEPISGGSIHQLKAFLNIATEQDFQLVIAFAHAAIRPVGPFPILCVTGENGSAKSSLCETIAKLIDPQSGHKLKIGNSEDQTFVLGENRWMMDFDNLSGITNDASDALCRIATGASLSKRKLYSDGDQHLSTLCRPIIANGIDTIATRNDFADRAIVISLRRIPEGDRRAEEDMRREFAEAHPAILGALLDGIVEGLRRCSSIKLARLPRMADFARWAVACETAHWPDGGFERAYFANAALAGDDVLANDEVAQAVIELMERRSEWSGSASELKTRLEENVPEKVINDRMLWPRRANDIGKRLTRIQTALRRYGIEVDRTRAGGGIRTRTITIRHSEPEHIQQNEGVGTTTEDLGQEGQEIKISCPYHNPLIKNDLRDLGTRGTTNSPKTLSVSTKQKWRVEL